MNSSPIGVFTSLLIAISVCGSGCKKGNSPVPRGDAEAALKEAAKSAALVNAKIPVELRGKLNFKAAYGREGDLAMVIPEGWKDISNGPFNHHIVPLDANLGSLTSILVTTACAGLCAPKDWEPVIAEAEFTPNGQVTIDKDEKISASERLMLSHSAEQVFIRYARWNNDWSRYFYCRADLDHEGLPLKDTFIQACKSLQPIVY